MLIILKRIILIHMPDDKVRIYKLISKATFEKIQSGSNSKGLLENAQLEFAKNKESAKPVSNLLIKSRTDWNKKSKSAVDIKQKPKPTIKDIPEQKQKYKTCVFCFAKLSIQKYEIHIKKKCLNADITKFLSKETNKNKVWKTKNLSKTPIEEAKEIIEIAKKRGIQFAEGIILTKLINGASLHSQTDKIQIYQLTKELKRISPKVLIIIFELEGLGKFSPWDFIDEISADKFRHLFFSKTKLSKFFEKNKQIEQPNISEKNKSCPFCLILLKSKKYELHVSQKCPKRNKELNLMLRKVL